MNILEEAVKHLDDILAIKEIIADRDKENDN